MEETKRRRFIIRAVLEGEVDVQEEPQPVESYTYIEYIESTGNEYLDMGIAANSVDTVEIDAYSLPSNGYRWLYGASTDHSTASSPVDARDACRSNDSHVGRFYAGNTEFTVTYLFYDTKRHKYKHFADATNEIVYKDGVVSKSQAGNYQYTSNSMFLFSANSGGTALLPFIGRLWGTKVYNGETLVADLRPAIRNTDQAVGMYDEVRDIFLENQGTGAFIAGPEI